jgi:hypothetical protein
VVRSLEPAFAERAREVLRVRVPPAESAGYAAIRACTEKHGYSLHAIRKTAFSTTLVPAPVLVPGSTDYAHREARSLAEDAARSLSWRP